MGTGKESPAVMFLFGAGISISVGVPAMHGMVTSFLTRSKSGVSDRDKKTCEFFEKELGVPRDLEEFLLAANSICEYPSTRTKGLVERSISPRKGAKSVLEYRKRLGDYRDDAAALRDNILNFMARTCFQFDREKARSLFTPLVTALSSRGYSVYTTNYDFALEDVALHAGITLHDNFHQDGQRSLWNPDIDFDPGDGLTLVKLHGSVTWYSSRDGEIEKIYSYTDINPVGQNVNRLVIAPTRFKDIYAQHFFALYSHFLATLTTSSVLVVAGHSLRDDYLRAAVIERCRRGEFNLIIIDPTFPPALSDELTVAKPGKAGPVTHVPHKFEDFADEIAALCPIADPGDFARECANIVHQQRARSNKLTVKGNIGVLKVGSVKKFKAEVDAYLSRTQRPAKIRVWLEAEYVVDGQRVVKVSDKFLEIAEVEVGAQWSGVIKSAHEMNFTVPLYGPWLEYADKATLHVAVVKASVSKPSLVRKDGIFAEDTRELTYHD